MPVLEEIDPNLSASAREFVKRGYIYISNKLRHDAAGELEAPFSKGTNAMRHGLPQGRRVEAKGKLDFLIKSLYETYG